MKKLLLSLMLCGLVAGSLVAAPGDAESLRAVPLVSKIIDLSGLTAADLAELMQTPGHHLVQDDVESGVRELVVTRRVASRGLCDSTARFLSSRGCTLFRILVIGGFIIATFLGYQPPHPTVPLG